MDISFLEHARTIRHGSDFLVAEVIHELQALARSQATSHSPVPFNGCEGYQELQSSLFFRACQSSDPRLAAQCIGLATKLGMHLDEQTAIEQLHRSLESIKGWNAYMFKLLVALEGAGKLPLADGEQLEQIDIRRSISAAEGYLAPQFSRVPW